ncbi:glycosyltransferase 87 family protein [Antrihabitans sp. NCIMB 15449]|uniref:Glycosyltransferase 87 family protein n=1 Tax=Antrihabitans spumae TaxID=3373370 RepID=A0ABW7JL85_9NOCA
MSRVPAVRNPAFFVVFVVGFSAVLATLFESFTKVYSEDLAVYRSAGQAVRLGSALYDASFGAELPFTYPPFAALVAVPLTLVQWGAAQWLWAFATILVMAWCIWLSYDKVPVFKKHPAMSLAVAMVVWTASGPVADHLGWGQVGMMLMALCLTDLLARPRWLPQGVLIGVAAAIKLVPGLLLGYFLLLRQARPFIAGIAGFLGATLLAALLLPTQSRVFFFDVVTSLSDRVAVGNPAVYGNQSVRGAILRLLPAGWADSAWLIAVVLTVAGASVAALRAYRVRGGLAAFTIVGLGATLITPVAWPHHFVWLIPAVGVLLTPIGRSNRIPATAVVATAFVAVVVLVRLPKIGFEMDTPVVAPLFENSLLLAALVVIVALAVPGRSRQRSS